MATITRRKFLKSTVALGAGSLLYLYSDGSYKMVLGAPRATDYQLRVIHTNDHHARIEPQPIDAVTIQRAQGTTPAVSRLFGGLARRKTLFDQFRTEAGAVGGNPNILFLDAGDVFQGTLFFNLYNGQADADFYIDLGYDAMTIGNHEFDKGPQPLIDFMHGVLNTDGTVKKANTIPMASANIAATSGPLAAVRVAGEAVAGSKIGDYVIKTVGTKKIGIFGLTTAETKVSSSPGPGVDFADPIATATATVAALKTAGANVIIALTHIGYDLDQQLAAAVDGIDLIVGGHSHTPLLPTDTTGIGPVGVTALGPYPTLVTNTTSGKQIPVVTDWEWGKWVGDITLGFDTAGGTLSVISGTIHPVWADYVAPNTAPVAPGEQPPIAKNADFDTRIQPYAAAVKALNAQKIGATAFKLEGGSSYRNRESTGGDLIADALLASVKNFAFPNGPLPLVAILNSGGIRAEIPAGDVTVGNVLTVLPFGNTVATVDLTGAQVVAALENGVSQVEANGGRFPQVAGLRYFWNKFGAPALQKDEVPGRIQQKGSRITRVDILGSDGKTYTPIDPAAKYRVVTNNFQLGGGDGYFVFTKGGDKADPTVGGGTNQLDTGLIMADVVQNYIAANSQTTPQARPTQARIIGVQALLPLVVQAAAAPALAR